VDPCFAPRREQRRGFDVYCTPKLRTESNHPPNRSSALPLPGAVQKVHMTLKYFEQHPEEVSRFSVSTSAEVTIQIAERDGHQFIIIKEQSPDGSADNRVSASEHTVEIPAALLPELKRAVAVLEENFGEDAEAPAGESRPVSFAHESEAEFARILDFYHIDWRYEPRTFAIEWDDDGNVVSSFTPDFYLPNYDLFIELTTLKQSLVTKKNRKVRLMRSLYPEINLKMLYASDYRKLLERFAASGKWQEDDSDPVQFDEE
jgi:hypothetical protein